MSEERHDDHIWITAGGSAWAIYAIHRPRSGRLIFELWRGYWPDLEWSVVLFEPGHDWGIYCERAARLLREKEEGHVTET